MERFFLLLHLLGAIWMGFYLLLPFLAARLAGLPAGPRAGFASGLTIANRWGQILLIVQLLTGGYLVGKAGFSTAWVIVVIVLVVLIGAFAGMLGGPLKRLQADNQSSAAVNQQVQKIRLFSWLVFVCFLAMVLLMYYPEWL